MTKRQLSWVALAVLGPFALLGALWSAFGPDKIVLTTAQLQERINRALPREFKAVTVEQASVAVADSRVALRVQAHAAALGHALTLGPRLQRGCGLISPHDQSIASRRTSKGPFSRQRFRMWRRRMTPL
jgi:hypothetical protein